MVSMGCDREAALFVVHTAAELALERRVIVADLSERSLLAGFFAAGDAVTMTAHVPGSDSSFTLTFPRAQRHSMPDTGARIDNATLPDAEVGLALVTADALTQPVMLPFEGSMSATAVVRAGRSSATTLRIGRHRLEEAGLELDHVVVTDADPDEEPSRLGGPVGGHSVSPLSHPIMVPARKST